MALDNQQTALIHDHFWLRLCSRLLLRRISFFWTSHLLYTFSQFFFAISMLEVGCKISFQNYLMEFSGLDGNQGAQVLFLSTTYALTFGLLLAASTPT